MAVCPGKGMGRTPQYLLSCFDVTIAWHSVSHCLLDPLEQGRPRRQERAGGYEPYLIHVLGQLTDWTVNTKQKLTITAHQAPRRHAPRPGPLHPRRHQQFGRADPGEHGLHHRPGVPLPQALPRTDSLFQAVALYLHKARSHKLVGFSGSLGEGSERPDVAINFKW